MSLLGLLDSSGKKKPETPLNLSKQPAVQYKLTAPLNSIHQTKIFRAKALEFQFHIMCYTMSRPAYIAPLTSLHPDT